jgi:Coenzyme PQQ synthesis protein D (PqqD)
MHADLWQLYIQQNPATPTRSVDGEALVITPHDSTLHALNQTATFVWDRADGSRRLSDIAEELLANYDIDEATLRAEVLAFVADARARGLVLTDTSPMPAL